MPGCGWRCIAPSAQLLFACLLLILRVQNSELGGETDQLSDGGCPLDVYGMRRPHQVVGSQKELLRDRELTLAALPADLAVVDVAELATHRQRRGVVEERSRCDFFGT